MDDLYLMFVVPAAAVLLAGIYSAWNTWLTHRHDCDHHWSRWSDIKHGDGQPYQLRNCNKCNLYQQKTVQ